MDRHRNDAERKGAEAAPSAPSVYCIVPPELAELSESLSTHFAEDPSVEVVVERRRAERRGPAPAGAPGGRDRRAVHDGGGGERRAALLPAEQQPELPAELDEYGDRIAFVERVRSFPRGIIDRIRRLAGGQRTIAAWRERAHAAEQEAGELARALVGVAEDLRDARGIPPRAYAAMKRADHAIERYRERHSGGSAPRDGS